MKENSTYNYLAIIYKNACLFLHKNLYASEEANYKSFK